MNATGQLLLTPKGLNKIRNEYNLLKSRYARLGEELRDATLTGSDDSRLLNGLRRVEQEFLRGKLESIDKILQHAQLMVKGRNTSTGLGSEVTYEVMGEQWTVQLVESIEANPLDGTISVTSPLGKALCGAKTGDEVEVEAPKRRYKVKVVSID